MDELEKMESAYDADGVAEINIENYDDGVDEEAMELASRPLTSNLYKLCAQVTRERGYWKDQSHRWMNQTQMEATARDEAARLAAEVSRQELETRQKYDRLLQTCRAQRSLISKLQTDLTSTREELKATQGTLKRTTAELTSHKKELNHVHDFMGRGITVLEKRDLSSSSGVAQETARSLASMEYMNLEDNSQQQLHRAKMSLTQHMQSMNTTRSNRDSFRQSQNMFMSRSLGEPLSPSKRPGDSVLIVQRGGRSVRVSGAQSPNSTRLKSSVSLQPISPGASKNRFL
jgi:hypothetical protein